VLAVDRGPVPGEPQHLRRGGPDPEDRAVVGVAVDPVLVVVDDRAGALVVGDLRDVPGERERVGRGQGPFVLSVVPAGQAGVAPAQQRQARHPEQLRGPLQLGEPALGDRLPRPQGHPGATQLTRGGDDEDGARTGVGQAAQRDPGEDRLVVRVGVQDEDGVPAQVGGGDHLWVRRRAGPRGAAGTDGAGGQLRQQRQHPGQHRVTPAQHVRSVTAQIVPEPVPGPPPGGTRMGRRPRSPTAGAPRAACRHPPGSPRGAATSTTALP
jgi:hypothetical protein